MRKAILSLPVYFDDDVDPDALAEALDCVLATAWTTPEILDEVGNPKHDKFSVEAVMDLPEKPTDTQYILKLGSVDGPLFAEQRRLVTNLAAGYALYLQREELTWARGVLDGLTNFLDVIADQLHDRYGIPCLLEEPDDEEEDEEEAT